MLALAAEWRPFDDEQDPDPDSHKSEKSGPDPDLHQSEKRIQIRIEVMGIQTRSTAKKKTAPACLIIKSALVIKNEL
jgi:hypothetical protein